METFSCDKGRRKNSFKNEGGWVQGVNLFSGRVEFVLIKYKVEKHR